MDVVNLSSRYLALILSYFSEINWKYAGFSYSYESKNEPAGMSSFNLPKLVFYNVTSLSFLLYKLWEHTWINVCVLNRGVFIFFLIY